MISLNTPINNLRMVGPVYVGRLRKLGISTVGDLLYHIPFRYDDYSEILHIRNVVSEQKATIKGKVESIKTFYTKNRKLIQTAVISDNTGKIDAIWFNQPYLLNVIKPEMEITISGKAGWFGHKLCMQSPDYEITNNSGRLVHTGRLVPVYPETEGVSSKWIRSRIDTIFYKFGPIIPEILPEEILNTYNLMAEKQALYGIHYPKSVFEVSEAKRRLSFDEMLLLSTVSALRKKQQMKKKVKYRVHIKKYLNCLKTFVSNLPFKLTVSQNTAIKEILADLTRITPANRLLEGDVGSGKTVVTAIAIYAIFLNGYKSAVMAPTEILANQHFITLQSLLSQYNIKVGLITKSVKIKTPESFDVLVGTHALLSGKNKIDKLAFVVIDEQQRFGVEQRTAFQKKGRDPHLLSTTATPIPRTLALTFYQDLDLSILNDLPEGRLPVKTWLVPPSKRSAAYGWIKKQILSTNPHNQVFIVCPLISESLDLEGVRAVTEEYENLQKKIFPDLVLDLLHGKMKEKEKLKVIEKFAKGETDILVSTTVVEVGMDIPNATIMVIEGAERFGLAQLHQLRGRVGRREKQSYSLLFTDSDNEATLNRLKLIQNIYNGPKLAEMDYKLRGGGDKFGTRQHGFSEFKIADPSDLKCIEESQNASRQLLKMSEDLSAFPLLKEKLLKYTISKSSLN
jgi:ATP-dependent DNA helicase RecG